MTLEQMMMQRKIGTTALGRALSVDKTTVGYWLERGAPPVGWVRHVAYVLHASDPERGALMRDAVAVEEQLVDARRKPYPLETEVSG